MTPEQRSRNVYTMLANRGCLTDRSRADVEDIIAQAIREAQREAVEGERMRCHDILIREADRHDERSRNETLSRDRAIMSEERARVLLQVADDHLRARAQDHADKPAQREACPQCGSTDPTELTQVGTTEHGDRVFCGHPLLADPHHDQQAGEPEPGDAFGPDVNPRADRGVG